MSSKSNDWPVIVFRTSEWPEVEAYDRAFYVEICDYKLQANGTPPFGVPFKNYKGIYTHLEWLQRLARK